MYMFDVYLYSDNNKQKKTKQMKTTKQIRTEQNIKVNFGRVESMCGYIMKIQYFNGIAYASYSLYNDSHFGGGINSTSMPVDKLPLELKKIADKLI